MQFGGVPICRSTSCVIVPKHMLVVHHVLVEHAHAISRIKIKAKSALPINSSPSFSLEESVVKELNGMTHYALNFDFYSVLIAAFI